jgi:hypothetical protein
MTTQQLRIQLIAQRISIEVDAMNMENNRRLRDHWALAYDEHHYTFYANQINNLLNELEELSK